MTGRLTGVVLGAALHAAGRGWPVFPLIPGGKTPAIRAAHPAGHPCRGECGRFGHGFHDATTDPAVIEAWWRRWPGANYGISTGPAGLVLIDLDTPKAPPPAQVLPDQGAGEVTPAGIRDGADVLTWAADRDGAAIGWGDTLTVATPSGGTHLYYANPAPGHTSSARLAVRSSVGMTAGRITGLGWCIDVRAIGGYVVGPGSHGPGGLRPNSSPDGYAAIIKGAVQPVPGWLRRRLDAITTAHHQSSNTPCISASAGAWIGPAAGAPLPPAGTHVRTQRSGSLARAGYGAAALAGELAAISAARPGDTGGGGRNATVNRAAYKLGRLLAVCRLDAGQVTAALVEAATAVGLTEREARTAVASGLTQGAAHPRTNPHTQKGASRRTSGSPALPGPRSGPPTATPESRP